MSGRETGPTPYISGLYAASRNVDLPIIPIEPAGAAYQFVSSQLDRIRAAAPAITPFFGSDNVRSRSIHNVNIHLKTCSGLFGLEPLRQCLLVAV